MLYFQNTEKIDKFFSTRKISNCHSRSLILALFDRLLLMLQRLVQDFGNYHASLNLTLWGLVECHTNQHNTRTVSNSSARHMRQCSTSHCNTP